MCVGVLGEWLVIAGGHASSDYTNDVWRTRDGVDWEVSGRVCVSLFSWLGNIFRTLAVPA